VAEDFGSLPFSVVAYGVADDAERAVRKCLDAVARESRLAAFDGPARAIRCACRIRDEVMALGVSVRSGVHTGECELLGEKVGGIAVHLGARVCSAAAPNEVLVSSTVKDLVAGSGLRFTDRGERELKGVPGEWRLYAAEV
jgi:class 3 adenylate cyclase